MSKPRRRARSPKSASARQPRTARALFIGALALFAAMIGLIRYLKHDQEMTAQQAARPKMTSYVMDEAHLIVPDERARLNERLRALYRADGPQVVVATIARVTKGSIAEDAIGLARAWRIGHAGRNDGVLLLIAESERKARIEVGYGLEGLLTDAATRLIIADRMERHLQAGEWTEAARGGVEGVLEAIGQTVVAPNAGRSSGEEAGGSLLWTIVVGAGKIIVIVFFLAVMALFFVVLLLVALGILQTILLAIPGVAPRLKASKRWSWIARPLPVRAGGGSSGSDSSSDSGWSSGSSSSSDSSSDSGGGGDFGGGGSND